MIDSFEFEAEIRTSVGTVLSRALRRENKVPAVMYGSEEQPVLLTFDHIKVVRQLENEAVYSHVLTIKVDGREERVILKDLQRHPHKPIILHLDFQRISKAQKIRLHVPLHVVGEDVSIGVKKGGFVTHNLVGLEVACLPDALPEFIEVDVSGLDMGQAIYLSELTMPPGVEIFGLTHGGEQNAAVVTMQSGRTVSDGDGQDEEPSG